MDTTQECLFQVKLIQGKSQLVCQHGHVLQISNIATCSTDIEAFHEKISRQTSEESRVKKMARSKEYYKLNRDRLNALAKARYHQNKLSKPATEPKKRGPPFKNEKST